MPECVGMVIHPTAIIYPDVVLGRDVKIGAYCVIGAPPEHRSFYHGRGIPKGVIIGDGVQIFELVTIHAGTEQPTEIMAGASIQNHSHIAHDCFVGEDALIGGSVTLAGHVHVMHNAIVAGHSAVHQWAIIGAYAILSAASYLKAHVPPGEKWIGSPARPAGLNDVGLLRNNLSWQECQKLNRDAFDILVRNRRSPHGI